MPQLDLLIIFPQIFWFFLIFIFLYLFILHYFLPKILLIIKFRQKLIDLNNNEFFLINKLLLKNKKTINNNLILNLEKLKNSFFLNQSKIDLIFSDNKFTNPEILNKKSIFFNYKLEIYFNKFYSDLILVLPSCLNLNK
uniref:ATP synthase F0 subunit 8 n=1 Tax=Griffithsia okiensis TaxID=291168 RepID=UPI002E78C2AA|nr:ATP synthase F0 subunit 8 [Griffithsia okiensis]WQF69546.1 ATP synthase F0 subunit 8 [Griffithsia okiensis]